MNVPRCDVMLIGEPLDQATIEPTCHPPTIASSKPLEFSHFLPLAERQLVDRVRLRRRA